MDTVLRAVSVYAMLLIIFRISGKRSLAQITTFDLVLTLIISEAIQQALVIDDNSITNAFILVVTLVTVDIGLSLAKQRWTRFEKIVEGTPVILLENGTARRPHAKRARRVRGDPRRGPRVSRARAARPDQVRDRRAEREDHGRSASCIVKFKSLNMKR